MTVQNQLINASAHTSFKSSFFWKLEKEPALGFQCAFIVYK